MATGKTAAKAGETSTRRAAQRKASPVRGKTQAPQTARPGAFEGFPADFLRFFRELKKNNEREWFNANKDRYRTSVQAPMLAFISAMDLPLGRIADCFVADARPMGGSMFRIYRDTRFSHDKTPYKDHAACQFRHMAGKDAHAPGFYVHVAPDEVFFGGGIWRPPSPVLQQIRARIIDEPDEWKRITRAPAFRRRFGGVEGDALKRAPVGIDPLHPLIEDLKRTSFFAVQSVEPKAIQSKEFAGEVTRSFQALAPFMQFLTEAVGLPFKLDD
ncbi:MAG TPA: DUF2461 domain-containing protein [Candidatus Limnocylindrales bacterium]|nr:DUF2461 domain-containing protein [Candidatus Limnocylindrales bacterium]